MTSNHFLKLSFHISMSLDLFSSIDFFFSKFSFFVFFRFIIRIRLFLIFFFKKKNFSNLNSFSKKINKLLKQKFSYKLNFNFGKILVLLRLFYFILLRKLAGLFPFVFGWTSHILIIFQVSFFVWVLIQVKFLKFDFIKYFEHLTPQGVPLGLGFFLSKIELIRNFIRPLTLSLRLGINITTGHILLALISVIGVKRSFFVFSILLILATLYFFFELFVMFIQAIVYSLLISQYFEN